MRQFADGRPGALEFRVKPFFKLRHGHVRCVAIVKIRERQGKLSAKFLQRHFRFAGLHQDEVGRLQDGGQIVHQSAGPIENDIADHAGNLTAIRPKGTKMSGHGYAAAIPIDVPIAGIIAGGIDNVRIFIKTHVAVGKCDIRSFAVAR